MPAYMVGAAFFLVLWAGLFAAVPRTRSDMLTASLGLAHFGALLQDCYGKDYWNPQYLLSTHVAGITFGVEDYLFGFAVTGVAAALFGLAGGRRDDAPRRPFGESWVRLQLAGGAFIALTYLLASSTGINSVHLTNALCLAGAVAMCVARPRWIVPAVLTGGLTALVLFLFYEAFYLPLYPTIIDEWWHASALSGIRLGRVPVEELAWGFAMGVFIGPVVGICRAAPVARTPTRTFVKRHPIEANPQ